MDLTILKNFKARWFIFWAVISFIVVTIISFFIPLFASSPEWITLFVSLILLAYLLAQSKKYGITYSEVSLNDAMSKSRWVNALSITALLQFTATALSTALVALLFLTFENQIRDFFMFVDLVGNSEAFPIYVFVLSFINLCILAPLWEEIFFRGILLRRFTLKWSPQKSIIISSLLFGVIHLNPLTMIFAFCMGCLLGYLYLKTKSLLVPIILHSFANFFGFLQFTYINRPKEFMPETAALRSQLTISSVIFVVLFIALLVFVFKNYKNFRNFTLQKENADMPLE